MWWWRNLINPPMSYRQLLAHPDYRYPLQIIAGLALIAIALWWL